MPLPTLLTPGGLNNYEGIPVEFIISWIKKHMFEYGNQNATLNDRVLIIQAKTGSGKSTVLPVEIFRILRDKNTPLNIKYTGKIVICTQPRVLTAIELAKDVCNYYDDMEINNTVGYNTKIAKNKPRKGLIFATLGVLYKQLNIFSDEEIMNEYKFIILDEAHERTLNSDMTLFLLYHFYKRNQGNKDLPFLILTSATIDTKKYADYFNLHYDNIIKVMGQSFNIDTQWPTNDIENFYDYIISTIQKINKNIDPYDKSDILVFLPGFKEIEKVEKELIKLKLNILIIKLDSTVIENNSIDYKYLFEDYNKLPKVNNKIPRRVILSTAVAETGITIKTCKYVIDCGLHRTIESYPIYNIYGLITKPANKSRIIQRKGRVGRLFDGYFYPTYTEESFNELENQQLPEILTSSSDYNNIHLMLHRMMLNNFNISEINLLDLPSYETFIGTNIIATSLGFLDNNSELTKLGLIASKLSYISMEQCKIIFSGFINKVSILDLITICSFFNQNINNVYISNTKFLQYMKLKNKKYNKKLLQDGHILEEVMPKFLVEKNGKNYLKYKTLICDDFIELLFIFEGFINAIIKYKDFKKIEIWCIDHCLNYNTLKNVYYERESIINELLILGIDILYNDEFKLINQSENNFITTIKNIKICLYEGLKNNLIIFNNEKNVYENLQGIVIKINSNILNNKFKYELRKNNLIKENLNPKFIITNKNLIVRKPFTDDIIYDIITNFISILDGFVYPDLTFSEVIYDD